MELSQLAVETSHLKEMITIIDSNVKFNFQMLGAALAVLFTGVGASLYFLAKIWVREKVQKEIVALKSKIVEEVQNYELLDATRDASLNGIQTIQIKKDFKICIINAYFFKELKEYRFIKNTLVIVRDNRTSFQPITITNDLGQVITINVNEVLEDRITLIWNNNGDIPCFLVGLEIIVF